MFGGGCYFAEDSSKSNQYIPCPNCGEGAIFTKKSIACRCPRTVLFPMFMCRTLLGARPVPPRRTRIEIVYDHV